MTIFDLILLLAVAIPVPFILWRTGRYLNLFVNEGPTISYNITNLTAQNAQFQRDYEEVRYQLEVMRAVATGANPPKPLPLYTPPEILMTPEQRRDKYDLREVYKTDLEAQERRKEAEEDRRRSRYNKTHFLVKNVRRILQ